MVRGRKALPTNLKIVKGERSDRINDDEPIPEDGVPQCPSAVPAVREVWDYTIVQLQKMRVVTMADRDMINAFCEAVVMHRECSKMLAEEGYTIFNERSHTVQTHPAARMLKEAAAQIKALGTEFGLTPAARTRIKVADQQPDKKEQGGARLLSS